MRKDKGYWQKRCELAEKFISESPCDPDITEDQCWAYAQWQGFINHTGQLPWFEAPKPPKKERYANQPTK